MRGLLLRGVAILGVVTIGGCTEGVSTTDPGAPANLGTTQFMSLGGSSVLRLANERTTARIARGIAMAMERDQLRHGVLTAMRNSPYVEHKLSFQEFIRTDLGRTVLAAAAQKLGDPVQRLEREIATLPQLDFYVPVSSQRQQWKGTPDVAVAAMYRTRETTVDLYRTDGSAVTWSKQGAAPDFAVVVLHPADRRSLRPAAVGSSVAAQASLVQCDESTIESCDYVPGGGEGGGLSLIGTGVYIDHFNPQDDDGWGFGNDEVRFTFTFESDGQIVVINRSQAPFVGDDTDILVSSRTCDSNSPPHFTVHLEEDDGGLNGDDDEWGTYQFPPLQYNVTNDLQYQGDRKMWLRMKCM